MENFDLDPLRAVMRQAVEALDLEAWDVEAELDLDPGELDRMLDGDMGIDVLHLMGLSRLLGVPPGDFLRFAYPEVHEQAEARLTDLLAEGN
jgi:hypothetical protein